MGNFKLFKWLLCAIFIVGVEGASVCLSPISSSLHLVKNNSRWEVKDGLVSNGPFTTPINVKKFLPESRVNMTVWKAILTFPNPFLCDQSGKQWINKFKEEIHKNIQSLPLMIMYRMVESGNFAMDPNLKPILALGESMPQCVVPSYSGIFFEDNFNKSARLFLCKNGKDSDISLKGGVANIRRVILPWKPSIISCVCQTLISTENEVELVTSAGNQNNWALSIVVDLIQVMNGNPLQSQKKPEKLNKETDLTTIVLAVRVLLPIEKNPALLSYQRVPKHETLTFVHSFTLGMSDELIKCGDGNHLILVNFFNRILFQGNFAKKTEKKTDTTDTSTTFNYKTMPRYGSTKSVKMERRKFELLLYLILVLVSLLLLIIIVRTRFNMLH